MENPRTYGRPPFRVVVVHGGPGAGGELAPVARELARRRGALEPIQTATTLDGQVEELSSQIAAHAAPPVAIVGYSWGAWLGALVAAASPTLVDRLVLVSSGPFEARYVTRLREARLARLHDAERREFDDVLGRLADPAAIGKDALLARLGSLCAKSDSHDPLPWETRDADEVLCAGEAFHGVWEAAARMRESGRLLETVRTIRCPVVAIHGADDPHPAEGVERPLAAALADFRFVLLDRCGHTPWLERHARDPFFAALEAALGPA